MVRQLAVIHHLQQDVVDVRVGFLHLVEQQNAVRVLVNAIGQHAALIKPDIAGRGTDQAGHGVFLHVFRHVETQQFHTKRVGQLFRHLGLTHTCRPCEQVVADGFFGLAQAGTGQFDRGRQGFDRLVLTEDNAFQRCLKILEHNHIILGHILGRDARDLGDHGLDFFGADGLAPFRGRQQMLRRARFVDHIDGGVR